MIIYRRLIIELLRFNPIFKIYYPSAYIYKSNKLTLLCNDVRLTNVITKVILQPFCIYKCNIDGCF